MLVTKLVTPPPDRHEQETAWTRRRFLSTLVASAVAAGGQGAQATGGRPARKTTAKEATIEAWGLIDGMLLRQ